MTVRDLVTHHTGYVGDYFRDTGRGDDAIAKIVAKMANSPQLVPAGSVFSYSNAAFYVSRTSFKTIRGKPFEEVIRERMFAPLGMRMSFYFPGRLHDVSRGDRPHRHARRAEDRAALAHVAQRRGWRRRDLERGRPDALRRVARRCGRRCSGAEPQRSRGNAARAACGRQHVRIDRHFVDARPRRRRDIGWSNTAAPRTAICRRSR